MSVARGWLAVLVLAAVAALGIAAAAPSATFEDHAGSKRF